jgi:hypothetical protein
MGYFGVASAREIVSALLQLGQTVVWKEICQSYCQGLRPGLHTRQRHLEVITTGFVKGIEARAVCNARLTSRAGC